MGLDGVELVMQFEEEFGIQIPDAAAAQMRTPRDVIDHLLARLPLIATQTCQTQKCFHRVRRHMMESLALSRGAVRPETTMAALVPESERRAWWARFGAQFPGAHWPSLRLSSGLFSLGILLGLGGGIAVGLLVWFVSSLPWLGGAAGLVALIAISNAYNVLMEPLRRSFPPGEGTVGGLAQRLADATEVESGGWTRETVALRVRKCVVEQLGLVDGQYDENHRFVEDFGLD